MGIGLRSIFVLNCDRAKPSCWNCEQNNQDCFYHPGESGAGQELNCTSDEIRIEPRVDGMPWLDSFGIHPYHNLEGVEKTGGLGRWLLKARRGKSLSTLRFRSEVTFIAEEELKLEKEALLGQDAPVLPEGELDPILEDDIVSDVSSLTGSSSESQAVCESVNVPISFYCMFCLEHFGAEDEWAEHENSQHFLAQRFWVCMPRGPIEYADDGTTLCMFCLTINPDEDHFRRHKVRRCLKSNLENRTYQHKQEFEYHLRISHGQYTMNGWIENRWLAPHDDEWHWLCGFCDEILATWTLRAKHLSEHFKKGVSLSSWDFLASYCPIDRKSGAPITWFSSLGNFGGPLHSLQAGRLNR